jgi:hypothetical protein
MRNLLNLRQLYQVLTSRWCFAARNGSSNVLK